jgi:hypothetical protein
LCYEERPLDFLKILILLVGILLGLRCESMDVFLVIVLGKWELFDVDDNFLHGLSESHKTLHK